MCACVFMCMNYAQAHLTPKRPGIKRGILLGSIVQQDAHGKGERKSGGKGECESRRGGIQEEGQLINAVGASKKDTRRMCQPCTAAARAAALDVSCLMHKKLSSGAKDQRLTLRMRNPQSQLPKVNPGKGCVRIIIGMSSIIMHNWII